MKNIKYYLGKILGSNKYPLDAIGEFNPTLGIVSYNKREEGLSSSKAIWDKIVEKYHDDNKKLREINLQTKFILPENKLTKGLLKILGYQEIEPVKLN